MIPFMKFAMGQISFAPTDRQTAGSDGWSQSVLDHIDSQYDLWEGIHDRLVANNESFGRGSQIRYSAEERRQLSILLQNMKQFAPGVGGERGKRIASLESGIRKALREYDSLVGLQSPRFGPLS